ncbi:hypothetical protein CK203_046043 [Vitis vinifera]|uniref:Uncharacterized protein n=1 Tax=Vitis vinifera TaxID=29760 RepID=A0A438HGW6_VITVI|nr:hypothetical protein CK203_046043 [Vitis vinifera]
MSSKKKSASSARVSDAHEKSTDKLSVKEFRDRFCIPNGVIVEFLNGEAVVSTEKAEQDTVIFSKEQFNAGLRIINMLYNLDLTMLEVFFVYSLKKAKTDHLQPVRAPAFSSIGDGTARLDVGRGEGRVMVRASFGCLSKLFEIDAKERQCKTLLTAREPDSGRPGAPRASKEADAEKRRVLLDNREKKTKRRDPSEGSRTETRRRLFSKENSSEKEEVGEEEWKGREGAPLLRPLLTRRSTSLAAVARLANLAEEAASVNHLDSRNPDADAAEARPRSARNLRSGLLGWLQDRQQEIEVSCSSAHDAHPDGGEVEMATEPPGVPVMVPAEVAPGEIHPAVNVEAPNPEQESSSLASSEGNPVNDAACCSASPFSYAELEEKLKQIPLGLPTVMPSAQMFEMVETLVSGLRGHGQSIRSFH